MIVPFINSPEKHAVSLGLRRINSEEIIEGALNSFTGRPPKPGALHRLDTLIANIISLMFEGVICIRSP